MDNEVNAEKIPIRGWLILVGIIVWITPIGSLLWVIGELLLPGARFSWLELLLVVVQLVISIIVLVLFVERKRTIVQWFAILTAWSIIAGIASTLAHDTSVSKLMYNVIVDIILLLYVLLSQRVKNTFLR